MTVPLHPGGAARHATGGAGVASPTDSLAPLRLEPTLTSRGELEATDAHLAWELVRQLGLPEDARLGALTLATLALDALAGGSTRVCVDPPDALAARASQLGLSSPAVDALRALSAELPPALVGEPGSRRPLIRRGAHVALERVFVAEQRLVTGLSARSLAEPLASASAILEALAAHPLRRDGRALVLGPEQRDAIAAALARPLVTVSGGPGTGKTFIVVSLLRAAVRAGVSPSEIAIAAPTGKASDRLRASIDAGLRSIEAAPAEDQALVEGLASPRTVHRLLGRSRRRVGPAHHPGRPLPARLVLVDEASMVDLFVLTELVRALRADARLVLLGDADQLPSVDAGAVFRDLCAAPSIATTHLTHSHRMDESQPAGRHILSVAADINAGRLATGGDSALRTIEGVPARLEELRGVHHLDATPADREGLLDRWLEEAVLGDGPMRALARRTWSTREGLVEDADALRRLLSHLERRRLLTLTRGAESPTGLEAINAVLHRRYVALERGAPQSPGWLRAGEPVLVRRNDYERQLFNGDTGVVLFTREVGQERARIAAVFARGERLFAHPLDAIRGSLELAYATTVHQAQGSEHDQVLVLLPAHESRLATREILYTAITRARRSVLIVGERARLARAIRRRIERDSGVPDALTEAARSSDGQPRPGGQD